MDHARSHGRATRDGGDGNIVGDGCGGLASDASGRRRSLLVRRGRGVATSRASRGERDDASSSSSSYSSSTTSRSTTKRWKMRWVRLRSGNRRSLLVFTPDHCNEGLQDLALPLGMSFAAVIAQVLFRKSISKDDTEIDHLSKMCSSAVKESITNIYGQKFDCFIRNFDKSFCSSLKTLGLINNMSVNRKENTISTGSCSYNSEMTPESTNTELTRTTEGPVESAVPSSSCYYRSHEITPNLAATVFIRTPEGPEEHAPFKSADNQFILHRDTNQQLANIHSSTRGIGFNQSILSTIERSVIEQTRSNDLKAVEIELIMKKLQLKQSQLVISSAANLLEKIKISLGISKASFKEEKLRNQMQETRHAQLLQRCMDLLIAGLIVMCIFLAYGAFIFSYQRLSEVTSACMSVTKKSKSWWIPQGVQSFSSGMDMLRCQFVVLSRMSFGILMIVAIAYVTFQRSVKSAAAMPVTFIALLLGVLCGFSGKLCIDTLGGNGYRWLIDWEVMCMIHFFANAFPSTLCHLLYGPVTVCQGAKSATFPFWVRRYAFYTLLLPILPMSSGLLPFASVFEWKVHLAEKLASWGSNSTTRSMFYL
ncbi:protein CPR-5-like [Curcuma longa]|uniref:protein CPR-5-like n=1 Tax=Curcuma longa TaxID=136217 RepID=UPI003D9E1CEE